MSVSIPYGFGHLTLWHSAGLPLQMAGQPDDGAVARVPQSPDAGDEQAEIMRALMLPIGTPRLSTLVERASSAIILISDLTRPCPSYKFLPALLSELESLDEGAVTIVFALGGHRRHTLKEQRQLVGDEVASRGVKLVDFDEEQCVSAGRTSRGTPLEVFRPYLDAELRVGTGNIEPHYFAGFSGGAKAVVPGVCSRKTIARNHSMMLAPGAKAGILEGNPVREDIDEAGRILGLDFIFNVVLDDEKRILDAVAGHPVTAHRRGVHFYERRFAETVDQPFDIVVASSGGYPKDLNLYQAQKTLDNVSGAVRDGGVIILAARCQEGFGNPTFEEWLLSMSQPADLVTRIQRDFQLGGHKAAAIAALLSRVNVYLISEFPDDVVRGFLMEPVHSLGEGLEKVLAHVGSGASVLVVPHGRRVTVKGALGSGQPNRDRDRGVQSAPDLGPEEVRRPG